MEKGTAKILVVDDDEYVLLSLKILLEQHKYQAVTSNTPERIPALLEQNDIQTAILDMNFRQGDTTSRQGLFWLRKINEMKPDVPVLLITAYGEISLAVEAMKTGAHDFITKPWENEKLMATVNAATTLFRERLKVQHLSQQQRVVNSMIDKQYGDFLGSSAKVESIRRTIEKIAPTDAAVLILGQNGTGKEVVARSIHRQSGRNNNVFVSVDVGSLSENIFESELFGHKKGAFTDAKEDRIGRIEAASGGTLFLDEIGNIPMSLQSKLLQVLQNKTITRLGTNHPISVDIRIVAATNSDLRKLVAEGRFREDLYYRVNTVELHLPRLADHSEDIPLLAGHFMTRFASKYQKEDRTIPARIMERLVAYDWPGNVRELQHAVERAMILSDSKELTFEDFGIGKDSNGLNTLMSDLNLERLEGWAIQRAIEKHKGNISHAAAELGLSRGAMYRRMEKYDLH
jgi:two-component system, NtrC family, response regulator HydG